MPNLDYYDILGVPRDADAARIKSAYRDLALKYHPDRNDGDPGAAQKMGALNEAYAVLSDPGKRRDYDAMHQQYGASRGYRQFRNAYSDADIFSGADIQKVFDELARSFGFRNFEEISKEFRDKGQQDVHFKGFFFFGGRFGPGGRLSRTHFGNLLGQVAKTLLENASKGQLPQRGRDLHDTIRVNPGLAERGGPYAYLHKWNAKKLIVKIPSNTVHGRKIRLSGMGAEGRDGPGDLYLTVETRHSFLDRIRRFLP